MLRKALTATLIAMSLNLPALAADADHVEILNPYARAVPPTAPASAAFMVLKSQGAATALVAAQSDVSEVTELHTHVHDHGVMRMRPVKRIPIPAHGKVELKPGGYHIMLIKLKKPLKPGDTVHLKLTFQDGSTKQISAPVKMIHAGMDHSSHMNHHHMGQPMAH